MINYWLPQTIDNLCLGYRGKKEDNGPTKEEKIVRCLFFAVNQGGEFWNVVRKGLVDQYTTIVK